MPELKSEVPGDEELRAYLDEWLGVSGYTDFMHLAPAYFGALVFGATVLRLAGELKATRGRGA